MRFAARLAIAIATLLSSALLCWGQTPLTDSASLLEAAPAPARAKARPNFSPPQAAEGTWVSDQEALAAPRALAAPQVPSQFPDSMPTSDDQFGTSADGSCQDGACGAGLDGYGGRQFNDLWEDVHAHRRLFVQADYLSFWTKGNLVPPLVTSSPLGTPQDQAGVLPESATTSILFGNGRVDTNQRNGGRINVGYWLVDGEFWGVEGQYFALQQQNTLFNAASDFNADPNSTILARPFFNVDPNLTPVEASQLIAFPNFQLPIGLAVNVNGSVGIRTTSNLQSAGALLRKLIWVDFTSKRRLDLVMGYRFMRLDDSVTIDDAFAFVTPDTGTTLASFTGRDQFSAKNQFNGGEIGLKGQTYWGRLSLELLGKVAFGNNHETVFINGFTTATSGSTSSTVAGGLLTQPTNIGTYRRDVFAILPEANANLRFDLTRNLRATLGYTFLYMNRVQRSGDAIDRTVNPTQIGGGTLVGDARPAFSFHDTTFWAHGANAGIEYRW